MQSRIRKTTAPYVFLLNPDALLKNGALAAIVAFLDEHLRCGIAGSRIYNVDGTIQQSCGEFDTWAGAFLRSSAWGELPPFRRFANGAALRDFAYDAPRRVDLVIGAAVGIRRAMLDEIGVFDERFFLYHEEVDLARRAATAGWETWFVPASEAVHEGMGSAKGQYGLVERRKQTSRRQYWVKHHGYAWYYALAAALIGRFVLYSLVVSGVVVAVLRLVRRNDRADAVVTFERVDGFRVVKSFGYAYGQTTRPRNVLRATFRSIGAFIGLAPVEYLTDAERSRTECLAELVRKADSPARTASSACSFKCPKRPTVPPKCWRSAKPFCWSRYESHRAREA